MKLENEYLIVEIEELGAEVTRIYDKQNQTEILWEGNPTYWKRHSPILFPNVGKTYQNTLLIDGQSYPTSQHGFARDSAFDCESITNDEAVFCMKSDQKTKKVYPFEFVLTVCYRLVEKGLQVQWGVKNPSDRAMYFTIGGHPAFRFAKAEEGKSEYCLKFPGKESLQYLLIHPESGTADLSANYELELDNECYPLSEELFDKDALIFDDVQIEEVWICHKNGQPYVGMECKEFPNFGIWSVKDAPFVCLEPWIGRCDNHGFAGDISEKPGITKVDAGENFRAEYKIVVA